MALSQALPASKVRPLPSARRNSILYHDVFNFPLKKKEILLWQTGEKVKDLRVDPKNIILKNGFYFLKGKEDAVYKRLLNEKFSKTKMKIAMRASMVLGKIPWVVMVGVTGSLAMMNAGEGSDIDLMIVASRGTVWMTRLVAYAVLFVSGFGLRRAGENVEKDRLCMNIWLEEGDLRWTKKISSQPMRSCR